MSTPESSRDRTCGEGFSRLGFPVEERLKNRSEIRRVLSGSRKVSVRGAKLLYVKNGLGINRVLFVPVRKYGTAVQRNRVKRLGRESYRRLRPVLKSGYDLAIVFFRPDKGYGEDRLEVRAAQVGALFALAGLTSEGQ
jgi:ribonuclease P protein component